MSANPQYGSRFGEQAAERRTQMENGGAQNSDGKTKVATPAPMRNARGDSPDEVGGVFGTHVVSQVRQPPA
jgi:hypothetical protein